MIFHNVYIYIYVICIQPYNCSTLQHDLYEEAKKNGYQLSMTDDDIMLEKSAEEFIKRVGGRLPQEIENNCLLVSALFMHVNLYSCLCAPQS